MMPTILVDADDVMINLVDAWRIILNKRHGTSVRVEDIDDWDVSKAFPSLQKDKIYAPLYEDGFWRNVKPKEHAVETLRLLKNLGFNIYVVTSTNYQTVKEKMEDVLFKYFDFIEWGNIIITQNKQMILGDYLIDDGPHNLVGGTYKKILMDAPHNRKFNNEEHGIKRVFSWNEIYLFLISEYI